MRTIVHLSDVHFGSTDERMIVPLIEAVNSIKPQLVAVSGDLTQRARSHQFKEARAFLDQLPQPQIVVPGNHDVPLYNILARFLSPLQKYRRYITDDLQPFHVDDEIAIFGVNTARSLTIKSGRINQTQVGWLREKLCDLHEDVVKVIVSHHPFDLPEGRHPRDLVGRADMAMMELAKCGADVYLAGHLHMGHTGHTATRYKIAGYSALIVQAGTAVSTRSRGEANSFNVLHLEHPRISVERYEWHPERQLFTQASVEAFQHTENGWARL